MCMSEKGHGADSVEVCVIFVWLSVDTGGDSGHVESRAGILSAQAFMFCHIRDVSPLRHPLSFS